MQGNGHVLHDVAVVGAGPVGCYTAWSLAQKGFDVIVLEKDRPPKAPPVCTGVVGVEAFREFDLPLQSVVSRVNDLVLFSPGGRSISYRPSHTQAYVIDRLLFDETLKARAAASGVVFHHGSACTDIQVNKDHVHVTVSSTGAEYRARTIVVASGYNPRLTEKLGLGRIPEYLQGVQVDVCMSGLSATEVHMSRRLSPLSFAWVVPTNGTTARVGLVTKRRARLLLDRFLDSPFMRRRVRHRGHVTRKLMPRGQLDRSFADKTIVVGEAAGQVKSTTYGGIYYGLIAARCAVETLTCAFEKGNFDAEQMSAYEDGWRQILEKEMTMGFLLQTAFSTLREREIERLFELVSANGILQALHDKGQFDWHSGIVSYLIEHPTIQEYVRKWE